MKPRIREFAVTEKPWGRELLITHNAKYAFKEIRMRAGTRSSLQSHQHKLETIFVAEGEIELEFVSADGRSEREIFRAVEAYTIPAGLKHRVKVLGDCRLFEVSTPELDDVIRHQDDFGRP